MQFRYVLALSREPQHHCPRLVNLGHLTHVSSSNMRTRPKFAAAHFLSAVLRSARRGRTGGLSLKHSRSCLRCCLRCVRGLAHLTLSILTRGPEEPSGPGQADLSRQPTQLSALSVLSPSVVGSEKLGHGRRRRRSPPPAQKGGPGRPLVTAALCVLYFSPDRAGRACRRG